MKSACILMLSMILSGYGGWKLHSLTIPSIMYLTKCDLIGFTDPVKPNSVLSGGIIYLDSVGFQCPNGRIYQ